MKETSDFQFTGDANRHVRFWDDDGLVTRDSDLRSQGIFEGGESRVGKVVPGVEGATYLGGIGIDKGFVLSTGVVSADVLEDYNAGIEGEKHFNGPNDAPASDYGVNAGEISHEFGMDRDTEFHDATGIPETLNQGNSGDPSAIEFDVTIAKQGWLKLEYVFASEELPGHPDDVYNDSFAVIVERIESGMTQTGGENIATLSDRGEQVPVQLSRFFDNGLLKKNRLTNAPTSEHSWEFQRFLARLRGDFATAEKFRPDGYFDHEFGAFTALRSCGVEVSPGLYRIRIVIQDVSDRIVDSALFIPDNGLSFEPLTEEQLGYCADFDHDGDVDQQDLDILTANMGTPNSASNEDGDADGDGDVDFTDFLILHYENNYGPLGCE